MMPAFVVSSRMAVAALAALLGLAVATPVNAVQTSRFGLAATGQRAKLVFAADHGEQRDGVVVSNRTNAPLALTLDVVGVTHTATGGYELGAAGAGLATRVRLATRGVTLPAKAHRVVDLTVTPPGHLDAPAYAAVTAVESSSLTRGVAVSERLAVLVEVDPHGPNGATGGGGAGVARWIVVPVAAAVLLGTGGLWFRRRRRAH